MKKEDGFQERSDRKCQTSEQTNWEDYEDEDVFDRIPLEQEIEPDALMEELRQERQAQQEVEKTENQPKQERVLGIASMVLGIFSILCFCIPVLGLVLAIAALVLGIVATAKKNGKKMGISGIVMGSIGLVSYLLLFLIFGGLFHFGKQETETLTNRAWRKNSDGSVLYLYEDGTFIDVAKEGVFSDYFYSGHYDILPYEDMGLSFIDLEVQYDMSHAYGLYLYVDTYVVNGEERDSIAPTICYLYLFGKKYETGDTVNVCAFDSSDGTPRYGSLFLVKETTMAYPTLGNQYVPTSETEAISTAETTETEPEELTTEDTEERDLTEPSTSLNIDDFEWGNWENIYSEANSEWEEIHSSISEEVEERNEEFNSAWEEAGSTWEEASSAMEAFSSTWEEASSAAEAFGSAWEEASSAAEELNENLNTGQMPVWLQNLLDWLRNLFSGWFG